MVNTQAYTMDMSIENRPSITEVSDFISDYAGTLMGVGVHTSRVVRNTKRLAESLGVDLRISTFPHTIILSVIDKATGTSNNRVVEIPARPISFEFNADLSRLSWRSVDQGLSLEQIKKEYQEIVSRSRLNPWVLLALVGGANASFCRLFGGDFVSMAVVFVATVVGFFLRTRLMARGINHYLVFILSAFTASIIASSAMFFKGVTVDVAISTSVLYLIPGVPLINGVIDILEGYPLAGVARLINTGLLIICIAIGLSFSLWIVKSGLI